MPRIEGLLDSGKVAVVAVNLTNAFWKEGEPLYCPMSDQKGALIQDFLKTCRNKGSAVIFAQNQFRKDGRDQTETAKEIYSGTGLTEGTGKTDLYPAFQWDENDTFIRMNQMSAFYDTDLEIVLRCMQIKTIVIVGARTDMECFFTARDAFNRDYQVIVASDLTVTGKHASYYDDGSNYSDMDYHTAFLNNLFTVMNADILTGKEIIKKII